MDTRLQALALQLLHDNEGMAIVILNFVDGAYGGVVQQAGGARLTLEALQGFAVSEQVIGKELDSHVATEPRGSVATWLSSSFPITCSETTPMPPPPSLPRMR